MAEDDYVAALGQLLEDAPVERRETATGSCSANSRRAILRRPHSRRCSSVGSIDPDGMLNGATTKLRSAQATSASDRINRARAPPLSRFAVAASAAAGRSGSGGRPVHRAACFCAARRRSRRGGIWRSGHYVPGAMAHRQHANEPHRSTSCSRPSRDRLSRLSFEVAGIYFDWSKTHLDRAAIDRFAERAEAMGFAAARDALFRGRNRQSERGPSGDPRRRARQRRARGCRPCDRAAAADARAGRRDRGRRVRRRYRHSSYRHRRVGAWPGAAGRRAGPPYGRRSTSGSCRISMAPHSTMR